MKKTVKSRAYPAAFLLSRRGSKKRVLISSIAALAVAAALAAPVPEARRAAKGFPSGFLWGTAVSGFQTEPGARPESSDPGSDWWAWVHDPLNVALRIVSGDLPESGPGSYELYETDIKLARKLKMNAFRLSIEWSRIFPRSTRSVATSGGIDEHVLRQLDALADQRAVAHYRHVLEAVRREHMTPFVTVNHFTLPLWLHDPIVIRDALAQVSPEELPSRFDQPAGWLEPDIAHEFAKYAAYLAWKYGDLVDDWTPINEPLGVAIGGYGGLAGYPPAALNFRALIAAVLHMIQANAAAYDQLKAWDRVDADGDGIAAMAGLVQNLVAFTPANPADPLDVIGAQNADYVLNRMFINAAVRGELDANGDAVIQPGEIHPELAGKADFIGVNYYLRGRVVGLGFSLTPTIPVLNFLVTTSYRTPQNPTAPECPTECSDVGWEIYPEGLRQVLAIAGDYHLPVYVTENGIADADDNQRLGFLLDHLAVLQQAIAEGVADVRGYFHWSLIDNLEWSSGYFPKFGLYSYDPDTLAREARPSARLYRLIAEQNALPER